MAELIGAWLAGFAGLFGAYSWALGRGLRPADDPPPLIIAIYFLFWPCLLALTPFWGLYHVGRWQARLAAPPERPR